MNISPNVVTLTKATQGIVDYIKLLEAPIVFPSSSREGEYSGVVYLLHANFSPLFKVGFATSLPKRITALQTACPYRLDTIATFPGTLQDEQRMHVRLRIAHYRGEWFRFRGAGILYPLWQFVEQGAEFSSSVTEALRLLSRGWEVFYEEGKERYLEWFEGVVKNFTFPLRVGA